MKKNLFHCTNLILCLLLAACGVVHDGAVSMPKASKTSNPIVDLEEIKRFEGTWQLVPKPQTLNYNLNCRGKQGPEIYIRISKLSRDVINVRIDRWLKGKNNGSYFAFDRGDFSRINAGPMAKIERAADGSRLNHLFESSFKDGKLIHTIETQAQGTSSIVIGSSTAKQTLAIENNELSYNYRITINTDKRPSLEQTCFYRRVER